MLGKLPTLMAMASHNCGDWQNAETLGSRADISQRLTPSVACVWCWRWQSQAVSNNYTLHITYRYWVCRSRWCCSVCTVPKCSSTVRFSTLTWQSDTATALTISRCRQCQQPGQRQQWHRCRRRSLRSWTPSRDDYSRQNSDSWRKLMQGMQWSLRYTHTHTQNRLTAFGLGLPG